MFLEVELPWNVLVPPEDIDSKGVTLQRAILVRLLNEFAHRKTTEEHGYHVTLTTLSSIGEGKIQQECGGILFPVVFNCITFKPLKGEILLGVVKEVLKDGVFVTCGPVEDVYIAAKTMADYEYVASAETPIFMNEFSKIEKNVTLRFKVLGTRWIEAKKEFHVLGSLAGDYLGPLSDLN